MSVLYGKCDYSKLEGMQYDRRRTVVKMLYCSCGTLSE